MVYDTLFNDYLISCTEHVGCFVGAHLERLLQCEALLNCVYTAWQRSIARHSMEENLRN
jgi:hypothetical protein